MAVQKEENAVLKKIYVGVSKETAEQRDRVELCSERILVMEEQVGMMAHNEAYKQSIEVIDELYQESMMPSIGQKEILQRTATEEEPIERVAFMMLNPASTSSSIQGIHV